MQPPRDHVVRADIMMMRHDKMRQHGLLNGSRERLVSGLECHKLTHDPVWAKGSQKLQLRTA